MAITLDGTTGVTAPAFDGALDATDLTGNIAAARITTALNASGSAPIYACRAWVNFNGTGTVAIRASGNVSSVTDNGVGDYLVNLTEAMPDDTYSVSAIAAAVGTVIFTTAIKSFHDASSFSIFTADNVGTKDSSAITIAVFR